jgi:hypothetical protein
MAVLKRKVNSKAKGFSPYAGEDPKPGVYRGRIIKAAIREAGTGRLSYSIFYELDAHKPEHKKYNGYTGFCELYLGDETEEWAQAGEAAFVKAVTGKDDFQNVNVAYEGKESDFKTPSGAQIKTLDGIKIDNKLVNINLRMEKEREHDGTTYPAELRARGILPWAKPADSDEEDEDIDATEADDDDAEEQDEPGGYDDDADEDGEEMTDEEWEAAKEARRVELNSRQYDLAKLRAVLKENGIETKGLKKPELVDAILDLEFAEDDEDEDGEEPDVTEDDVEADEDSTEADADDADEDDDEEDDEDEDDEEADEEDGEDLRAELEAEAADLDRAALKKAIKAIRGQESFVAKKSQSDDDLREIYVTEKLAEPAF